MPSNQKNCINKCTEQEMNLASVDIRGRRISAQGLPTAEKNGCILPGVWGIAYHKPLSVSGFTTVTRAFTHTVHTPNGSINRTMYLPKAVQQTPQKFCRRSHKTHLTISLIYNQKKGEKKFEQEP